jgi:galactonate dehydratase
MYTSETSCRYEESDVTFNSYDEGGKNGMKITDVHTYIVGNAWKNWLFVRVDTDEGISGIGEGTLNAFAKTVEAAIHELKHLVIGMSPFDVETISLKMIRDVYSDGGQIQGSALAAIETACWDIIGKATGQPVYKLLGGKCHDKLRCYANGWYRGGTPRFRLIGNLR